MIHCPGNLASVSKHSSSDSNTNKNCSMNMANIFEFLSKDGNITPEKARKSRQMQFRDKTAYVWGLRYRWDPSLSRNPVPRFPHFMPPCLSPEHLREPWKWIVSTFLLIDQIIVVITPKVLFWKLKRPFVPFVRDEVLQTSRRTHPNRNGFIIY